jgi:hypothetical protein
MKYLCFCILIFLSSLNALSIDTWQNIRFSEKTADNKVYLRTNITQGNINFNQLVYNPGTGNTEMNLSVQNAGTNTYQALVNAGTSRTYYGFRKQVGIEPINVVPVRYTGTALPAPGLLTKVSDAPANDQPTNYLDIIADYVTVSDTKLIVGLQTRGGGFPTGGFFGPWNSYMVGIADPSLEDPNAPGAVAWAFHYVSVPLLMSTGLYKITGTGISDVNRIGAIGTSIDTATNTLVMSCDMSLLLADPDFTSWYDVNNPKFALLSLINRISGSTVTQMDNSNGGFVYPVPLYVDPQTTPVGEIADVTMNIEPLDLYFQTQYTKPVDRFNWGLNYRTEDGRIYQMYTTDPEHAPVRNYRSANLLHVFPEVDNEQGRAWAERIPGVFQQSNWYSYSFVRTVNSPDNVQIQPGGEAAVRVSWDPVSQTSSGTPIAPDYYTVEYTLSPDQDFEYLLDTEATEVLIPLSTLGDKTFIRVSAKKNIP